MEENELEISKPPREVERKDSHFNYVDRVRIRDQGNFNGPGRTGGWRHRSLSSIDLSSNSSRSKDHNCSGQEVYSRLNGIRDYEDFYAVNNKVKKNNSLYDHIERRSQPQESSNTTGNTVCSLRRTRSLAVIREETYRDLRVTGVRNRRSQLIPRAKLIEKDIFREKYRKKTSEGETDSVKSHSSQGSEDFYTNLKRLDIIGVTTEDIIGKRRKDKQNWQTEKSDDLDSLDSSYFRNSSHQLSTSQDPSRIAFNTDTDCPNYNGIHSHLAETTTSNSDYSPEDRSIKHPKEIPGNESDSLLGIKLLDDVLKSEEPNLTSENNTINSKRTETPVTKLVIKLDGNPSRSRASVETPKRSPAATDFYKTRDEIKSIVSYDSIYLSSEVASDEDDNLYSKPSEVYVSNNHSGDTDTVEISLDDYDEISDPTLKEYSDTHRVHSERAARANIDDILEDENCLDTLYSQVNKSKPKIVGVEPKTSFASTRSGSDRASIVRSERYSVLSNRTSVGGESNKGHLRYKKNPRTTSSHQNHHYKEKREGQPPFSQDNHYYSLPDINIGKLLSDSEKIDAKLRLSSDVVASELNLSSKLLCPDYDSTLNYSNRQHRRRQRENCELILSEPDTVDELPREAPSIEVETPFKDPSDRLDLDDKAPTSLDTFGSDQESLQPNLFTVSIGGKQVIVDEVDKLNLKKGKKNIVGIQSSAVRRSNSLRDNTVLKESIANRDSEITAYIRNNKPAESDNKENEERKAVVENSYEKDIKDYFEERLLKKVNEVNGTHLNNKTQQTKNDNKASKSSKQKSVKTALIEMPRPQIMNVVHAGHKVTVTPEKDKILPPALLEEVEEEEIDSAQIVEAQQEFHEKVDSIRCYWSKLATSPEQDVIESDYVNGSDENDIPRHPNVDGMVKFLEKDVDEKSKKSHRLQNHFLHNLNKPTVEIIEFDDKTQTAVVKARSAENVFDHVRYKVVKTETFQKNLQSQKHKEAQFDGLMQYLQDYSFQELLANNNVVIIEPVRTKIEIISEKPVINAKGVQRNPACKITGVRVNKELIDEELPCPDTVRNVRKLFEGSSLLRVRSVSKDNIAVNTSTLAIESALGGGGGGNGGGIGHGVVAAAVLASNLKNCAPANPTRNLAVDTTSGGGTQAMKSKWDAVSLSSGVSSGELSSPCECNDIAAEIGISIYSGDEHLDDGKCCDPSYVSQDVLEKIRARGSTVTYYGGKVLDKRSCANGIMQEIYKNRCIACQPLNCPDPDEVNEKMNFSSNANYLGVRFKLVKSNSCSSRLELVGTGKINSLQQHQQMNQQISQNLKRDEDKRRSILHRLHQSSGGASESQTGGIASVVEEQTNESIDPAANDSQSSVASEKCVKQIVELLETSAAARQTTATTTNPVAPRIIDSKCIEKVSGDDNVPLQQKSSQLNGTVESKPESHVVTVNNSISIAGSAPNGGQVAPRSQSQVKMRQESIYAAAKEESPHQQSGKTKVVRNRNVDLALSIVKNQKNSPGKDEPTTTTNRAPQSSVQFKNAKELLQTTEKQRPVLTTFSQQHQQFRQQKGKRGHIKEAGKNGKPEKVPVAGVIDERKNKGQRATQDEAPACADATNEENQNHKDGQQQKLIKWSSINTKFDEKFYVTNDTKLKQKIYDEMEFEEFEVYDTATANECYDSLNTNK